ncbi:MAG: hypothetical protein C0594_05205 [Marinilabiliales bacterium]|nr:MAG: hypothetical protein C0594_05205 [Marinilabiliales bacterium]
MYLDINKDYYHKWQEETHVSTTDLFSIVYQENREAPVFIPPGSTLPFANRKKKEFILGKEKYNFYGDLPEFNSSKLRSHIVEIAKNYLNSPYLWGGKSPYGIDCSGFTQVLYKICNIKIPRDASQQVNLGKTLNFINEAQAGDLAFFDNDEGSITHVGMYLGDGKIIHASGKVRIDTLDHQGIYNLDTRRYSHKLRVIQSIIIAE